MLLAAARARGIASLDAEVLLQSLLGRPRTTLLAFSDTPVDAKTAALFGAGVERRAAGEPLAYITGSREFWSLPLVVTPAVLVPRPETELLVELCLSHLDAAPHVIADLGTGSGAIALALARERAAWRVIATDVSADALEVAAVNRRRLGMNNVELRLGSWCEPLGKTDCDAIVSNPPYIAAGHEALAGLQHEPSMALVAADHGFADLETIAAQARSHLRRGGLLLLEHGWDQAGRMAARLEALGYTGIGCHRDLAGLDRVTVAVWP